MHDGKKVESHVVSKDLYTQLLDQEVNLSDDSAKWTKKIMIDKLCTVMGKNCNEMEIHDPDDSYVLTVDNLIKMLAIQTRFRCDIPVVIIGETGCGKTRLIRYMCDLAKQQSLGKNLLIMKVSDILLLEL